MCQNLGALMRGVPAMDDDESLEEFASRIWDWDMNKVIPLGLVLAWMSRHWHNPLEYRIEDFEEWASSVAVKVDRE